MIIAIVSALLAEVAAGDIADPGFRLTDLADNDTEIF